MAVDTYHSKTTLTLYLMHSVNLRSTVSSRKTLILNIFIVFFGNNQSSYEWIKSGKKINALFGKMKSTSQSKDAPTTALRLLEQYSLASTYSNLPHDVRLRLEERKFDREMEIEITCAETHDAEEGQHRVRGGCCGIGQRSRDIISCQQTRIAPSWGRDWWRCSRWILWRAHSEHYLQAEVGQRSRWRHLLLWEGLELLLGHQELGRITSVSRLRLGLSGNNKKRGRIRGCGIGEPWRKVTEKRWRRRRGSGKQKFHHHMSILQV